MVLYREGVLVRVPATERYAVHKLAVASARTGPHRAKFEEDLMQDAALVRVLTGARPFELATAHEDATLQNPQLAVRDRGVARSALRHRGVAD